MWGEVCSEQPPPAGVRPEVTSLGPGSRPLLTQPRPGKGARGPRFEPPATSPGGRAPWLLCGEPPSRECMCGCTGVRDPGPGGMSPPAGHPRNTKRRRRGNVPIVQIHAPEEVEDMGGAGRGTPAQPPSSLHPRDLRHPVNPLASLLRPGAAGSLNPKSPPSHLGSSGHPPLLPGTPIFLAALKKIGGLIAHPALGDGGLWQGVGGPLLPGSF